MNARAAGRRNRSGRMPKPRIGMKPLTIQQIRHAVGGKALAAIPKDAPPIKSVVSDSKRVEPFSMFVAIKGERVDGHAFLPEAAARGAVAALVQEAPANLMPNLH